MSLLLTCQTDPLPVLGVHHGSTFKSCANKEINRLGPGETTCPPVLWCNVSFVVMRSLRIYRSAESFATGAERSPMIETCSYITTVSQTSSG